MTKYKSKFTGQQIDEGIEYGVRVTQQTLSSAQKQQARGNIGAQENVTDIAKLGCGIGTCSTSSGTALVVSLTNYELVQNGFVAVTFEHDVPAGATLNVNSKGAKSIIYKGSAITADTIKADDTALFAYNGSQYVLISSGAGGSVSLNEIVTISLTTNQATDTDILGATVLVTNDNTSDILLNTTWQNSNIKLAVIPETEYTITVGAINDYETPLSKSYKAQTMAERSVTFTYNTEVVTVTVGCSVSGVSVVGQVVNINGTEHTVDATGTITQKVPYGDYVIYANNKSGYKKPSKQHLTASSASRNVTLTYTEIPSGVFIYDTDYNLVSAANWTGSLDDVIGVAVLTTNVKRVFAPIVPVGKQLYSPDGINYSNRYGSATVSEATAIADMDGYGNTQKLLSVYGNSPTYGAGYCTSYQFKDGNYGYLHSFGELWLLYLNKTSVNQCYTAIGKDFSGYMFIWSSTFSNVYQGGADCFWNCRYDNGLKSQNVITIGMGVLPVYKFEE